MTTESPIPAKGLRGNTPRLPLGYRIGWRLKFNFLVAFGPADLDWYNDPRTRMRQERADRLRALIPTDPAPAGAPPALPAHRSPLIASPPLAEATTRPRKPKA